MFGRVSSKIRRKVRSLQFSRTFSKLSEVDIAPVFVIGANRSGTSVVSYLLSTHPELEGLFSGGTDPEAVDASGHAMGYCESYHVWSFFFREIQGGFQSNKVSPSLWGHPHNISKFYHEYIDDDDGLLLANALQTYRTTQKIPLVKDQLNMLRLGVICRIFPRAKFVLLVRDYHDYIPSCRHKWGLETTEVGSVGLHWYLLNSIAHYDLERFYPGQYSIFHYSSLYNSQESLQEELSTLCQGLEISDHQFPLENVSERRRFLDNKHLQESTDFSTVTGLAGYQEQYLRDLGHTINLTW